jgi:tRNA(fMet)-specific endonuclease VapC
MEKQLICLDTSVLIDYFRKTKKEKSFLYDLTNTYENFAVSVITEFEIYSGSNNLQKKFWDQFFDNITILPFDSRASQTAASLFKELKQKNKVIGMPDLLIGATALVNNLPLATLNVKDFERLENLKLIEKK